LQRLVTAFVIAAALAGGITYLFYKRINSNAQQRKAVQIVVAKADLSMGATLSANDVALDNWYADAPPTGAFTDVKLVVGRPLIYPISAKEPILLHDLGVEGAGIGLAGKIPEGMRAIAIRSGEIVGVAGFVYPGSKVDLLMTFTPPGATAPLTQTVLQNVEVLTAGQTIEPDPQGKPQQVSVVTLLLSPQDSQKLQLASAQGNIQFVLRSGADQKTAEVRPTRLEELVPGGKPAGPVVAAPGVKHGPRKATPASPIYLMEVIQGTSRTVQKF
jgi:pilus assembly protein CpaB